MNKFIENTIDVNNFKIENTKYDNACFYKSFTNCIIRDNMLINDTMSNYIQKIAYEWILENRYKNIDDFGLTVEELIPLSHNISIDEYIKIYKYNADDHISNIKDRWGSLIEQIALSEIFEIPIFIYTSQKYDINKKKITIGKIVNNKAHKGVRFKLFQQIGLKYIDDKNPICLLWKDSKYGPHYMSLYLSNDYILNDKGIPLKKKII